MTTELAFGSRRKILFVRAIQVVLALAMLLWHPQSAEPLWSWSLYVPMTLALFALSRLVYARLATGGFEYMRFGKWKFVGWIQVERATANVLGQITIELSGRPWWSRYLLFVRPSTPLVELAPKSRDAATLMSLLTP
jgi:hypothetical protein